MKFVISYLGHPVYSKISKIHSVFQSSLVYPLVDAFEASFMVSGNFLLAVSGRSSARNPLMHARIPNTTNGTNGCVAMP